MAPDDALSETGLLLKVLSLLGREDDSFGAFLAAEELQTSMCTTLEILSSSGCEPAKRTQASSSQSRHPLI